MLLPIAVVILHFVALLTKSALAQEITEDDLSSLNATTQNPDESRIDSQRSGIINYRSKDYNGTTVSDYNDYDDSGRVAGIVIGVIGGLALIGAVVAFCVYKQYVRRNVKSMNFDNPVYRKTTEDQFSLEKNQYQPTRSYPAVSEETLEPLTNPGTNEFV